MCSRQQSTQAELAVAIEQFGQACRALYQLTGIAKATVFRFQFFQRFGRQCNRVQLAPLVGKP